MADTSKHSLPQLFTTTEAAKYLGVSKKKLDMDRCTGKGPRYIHIGRLVRYRADDLLEYLNNNTVSSTAERL